MDTKQLQTHLQQKYDRDTWRRVLESVFASVYFLNTPAPFSLANSHVAECHQTGVIRLHDGKNIALFEARLDDGVHLLRNRVGVRNLMTRFIDETQTHGVLVVYDQGTANYRLTFVARESGITPQGEWVAFETASKRFTYVLGEGETCRTAAERLALLAAKKAAAGLSDVIDAFSVERLSKEFFSRYKTHYQAFVEYLTASNFRQSAFRGDDKAIRDFVKKLLGRIVFLHFLQKKGWLGATDDAYANGDRQFMQQFWNASGKRETFYAEHLRRLFFDALNNNRREQDAFTMPDGAVVKIPYLNGGLFDKDQIEERTEYLTFPSALFDALFAFFGEYNFTIDENDPEEREVGIDPEMLGHIFENLLEDNKDKGAFYTPKEIVQYMTQESLIEYLYAGLTRQPTPNPSQEGTPTPNPSQEGTPTPNPSQEGTPTPNPSQEGTPTPNPSQEGNYQETPLLGGDGGGLRKPLEYFIRYKLKGDELPEAEQGNAAQFYRAQFAFMQRYGAAIDRLLDAVKICDPAIGSGAFPMGLLNEIYHCKLLLNNTYTPADRAAIKRRIIEHSIYGVDLEKGAVDIARLRFWLALIVEEATPTPLPNLDYKIVVGDSLISKFQDHVIEIKWDAQSDASGQGGLLGSKAEERKRDLLKRVTERQRAFFHAAAAAKPALAQDIRDLKIDLLIAQLDAMIAQDGEHHAPKGTGKANQKQMERFLKTEGWKQAKDALVDLKQRPDKPFDHFDWKLDFPEILNPALVPLLNEGNSAQTPFLGGAKGGLREPGFDIVIGNPPYVQLQKNGGTLAKRYQDAGFQTFERTGDLYCLFYEQGHRLLNPNGRLCFITSNKWMRAGYGESMRTFFLANATPKILIDFGDAPLFENATTYTNILLFSKRAAMPQPCRAFDLSREIRIEERLSPFLETLNGHYRAELTAERYLIVNDAEYRIKQKVEKAGVPLKEWDIQINYGIKTGYNEAFIIDGATHAKLIAADPKSAEIIKPILRGKDIKRYQVDFQDIYVIATFPALKVDIEQYPAVKAYLKQFGRRLEQSGETYYDESGEEIKCRKKTGNKWFETQDQIGYYQDFEKEKIVWAEIVFDSAFYYDKDAYYMEATGFIMTGENVGFLVALLNSRLLTYAFKHYFSGGDLRGDTFRYKKAFLEQLPIIQVSQNQQLQFKNLVEQIQSAKQHGNDTAVLEREIDLMIYTLYDLTYDEARTVDPALSLSRADYDALPVGHSVL
ncbi:DNA modification methylase [Candidatus Moduliflexus flocculans]|uniref:site-specific DNA-methyltransferase (adenine-specific) n=1 Tax=Candidatus Moduliflexus flocculans TaxID=1499966 RepID=A0A0S6VZP6_9BACT|nr:DNA modification methylase [Candidatus Moduliflexus flocculans]